MSGHSKWATIKRKKGAIDQARGRLFSRLAKEIQTAARSGGGNPDGNTRLRTAIQHAREASMPADNIEKAIKRGTGQLPGVTYEEVTYEGYGAGGVAILAESLTDNRNRTASALRSLFTKNSGNLGELGCVNWMFERKGVIHVDSAKYSEDRILEEALEAGAEDVEAQEESFEIRTDPNVVVVVVDKMKAKGIAIESSRVSSIPKNLVRPGIVEARSVMKLIQALEEDDDVQNVHSNFDPPEELLAELEGD
jgi:YebC/PmpR family DNA-binding regulatory protein